MTGVDALLDLLETKGGDALRRLGFRGRLRVAGAAGGRFSTEGDPLREEALARLPGDSGLSPRAARELLDGMARDWTLERLSTALRADFPDPEVLDGFRPGIRGERLRVVPPRLLVQVGAGNVPGTGATALLRGFLVGAPTLLKPGSGDGVLPELMARALVEALLEAEARGPGDAAGDDAASGGAPGGEPARPPGEGLGGVAGAAGDPELGLLVLPWAGGGGSEAETRSLDRAERVVVYGGEAAAQEIRSRVDPLVPVVVYGPRVSLGVVLADAAGAGAPVLHAARAVAAYAQQGCVSPHLVWVEAGGERDPEGWAEALAGALAEEVRRLEAPPPAPEVAAAMRRLAEEAAWRGAAGQGDRVLGGPGEGWMVLYEPGDRAFEPSCLGHTVRVRPLEAVQELPRLVEPARRVLQSAAVEGAEPGRTTAALALARAGVSRITTFRAQPWPPAWWRHDGKGPLEALVNWATLEPAALSGPGE